MTYGCTSFIILTWIYEEKNSSHFNMNLWGKKCKTFLFDQLVVMFVTILWLGRDLRLPIYGKFIFFYFTLFTLRIVTKSKFTMSIVSCTARLAIHKITNEQILLQKRLKYNIIKKFFEDYTNTFVHKKPLIDLKKQSFK